MKDSRNSPMERILIVDDDSGFRRSLALNLQCHGYKVSEAKNGMDAIRYLSQLQSSEDAVEGVIIDAKMPGLDGFWLADQVVNKYPQLKIVLISAFSYPDSKQGYTILTKPVRVNQLIKALNH